MSRCPWCGDDPLYVRYHDEEWGVPLHDDRRHFELLVLESAQAGLSWLTVLRKRERYREVFEGFDPERVARFGEADVQRLMGDAGIIRHRGKLEAAVNNARRVLELDRGLSDWFWSWVDGPIVNRWEQLSQVPAKTELSDAVAAELKRRGFKWVGSTVIYAHLQAAGLVNDHLVGCFRHAELNG